VSRVLYLSVEEDMRIAKIPSNQIPTGTLSDLAPDVRAAHVFLEVLNLQPILVRRYSRDDLPIAYAEKKCYIHFWGHSDDSANKRVRTMLGVRSIFLLMDINPRVRFPAPTFTFTHGGAWRDDLPISITQLTSIKNAAEKHGFLPVGHVNER
jgi:hypothetical protein